MPGTKGRSGRKPAPTELKLLRGRGNGRDSGGRRINTNEPKPVSGAPECPDHLSAEAKAEWARVVPELDRLKLLAQIDRAALAAYCESWATFEAAEREIAKHGIVMLQVVREVEDDSGGITIVTVAAKNPAVQIARDAQAAIRSWCSEFGLTPSARSRMSTPEATDGEKGVDRLLS